MTGIEATWRKPHWANTVLAPLAGLYACGWLVYLGVYKFGFKKAAKSAGRTVCIGNLVVGGAGKSPMARTLAALLGDIGYGVLLGCSGYGSPRQHGATLAPAGHLDPKEWGDEPAMFRWLSPDLPLIVGRDRVLAAKIAAASFPDHILLMDDGYQHLRLQPDIRILLDQEKPVNRLCLPAGPYREPRAIGRQRADVILPRDFAVRQIHLPLRHVSGPPDPPGDKMDILCALGQPLLFIESIRARGIEPRFVQIYPDHDPLSAGNLWEQFKPGAPLVVTAKDWVKLRTRTDLDGRSIYVADVQVRVEPENEFKAWLQQKLHES